MLLKWKSFTIDLDILTPISLYQILEYRNAVYSRYSTNDWGMSNSMNFSLSDKERSFAERLRADAWRAVKETDARTRNRQNDITKKLGEHLNQTSTCYQVKE